jgi:preprotein translocase subunit SecD
MKKITLTLALILGATFIQAQNKNVLKTTETTVTTIKDSDGEKKLVKQEETQEVQNIQLKEAQPNTLNIEMKESPVEVLKTTQITNADGSTRTVDVDRSGYYQGENNMKYKISLDSQGYTLVSDATKKPDLLRKTSINTYIFRNKNTTAISYFDTQGNLVIETYNDKTDKVTTQKYMKVQE